MVEVVDANTKLFTDCDDFEHLFESIFNRYVGNGLPAWQYESVYNEVFSHMDVLTAVAAIYDRVTEYIQDHAPVLMTESDKLTYYGLVASDFVGVKL